MDGSDFSSLPILDLSDAEDASKKLLLLNRLKDSLFNIGFLYVVNHGVSQQIIDNLMSMLPALFELPLEERSRISKMNSPHFLGYSGFAEETTLGKQDLREQFDFASELPVVWQREQVVNGHKPGLHSNRDFSKSYWRLRGPNQWPPEEALPGFRKAFMEYHDTVAELSYRFVHLVEEAFGIPIGTFDRFFAKSEGSDKATAQYLPPQHRIKLLKYPAHNTSVNGQGVGPHKDSSGWLTFLYQVGKENALEVVNADDQWIPAPPIKGSFVVNFGNAFEAATEGAVRATIHRVKATTENSPTRYSVPFFQGLPLDLSVTEVRSYIPEKVRAMRSETVHQSRSGEVNSVSNFLDPRWDNLGESQLRKWIRSHKDVARCWYGDTLTDYYLRD